ncbi:MAG TPA: hypothetical protein VHF86_07190 [Xanthomonadaceae bacterium]|nr:hypothetical protein [Xanthomonadaceae bacterium]
MKLARPRVFLLSLAILSASLSAGSVSADDVKPGAIIAKKFYDANANGVRDTGEPWLSGWPMTLTGPTGSSTQPSTATWAGLAPGSYTVTEGTPLESNWVQTAPHDAAGNPLNPSNVTVLTCKTTVVKVGNYCIKGSGGRTPGFWSNKNGEARMNDNGTMAPELGLLSSLNLVDAGGGAFDPADYASFRTWLVQRDAVNMAYQLSAHLAAMTLNVEAGFVDGDSHYIPCNCTINELMEDADAALGADPFTPTGDPNRALQEQLKNWLDALNNNDGVVSRTPCRRTFDTY